MNEEVPDHSTFSKNRHGRFKESGVFIGVKEETPDRGGEARAALKMIKESRWKFKIKPKTLGADKGYATGEFVYYAFKEGIIPHIPIMDPRSQNDKGIFPITKFSFDAERNEYICPQGKRLRYLGIHKQSRQLVWRASVKDCKVCPLKGKCTRDRARSLSRHIYEDYVKHAREQTKTPSYRISQRMRKLIEGLFGEAKEHMGLHVAKFRRLWNVEEQFLLTATVQNIKRIVKLLHRGSKEARKAIQGVANLSNYAIKWLMFIMDISKTPMRTIFCSCQPMK